MKLKHTSSMTGNQRMLLCGTLVSVAIAGLALGSLGSVARAVPPVKQTGDATLISGSVDSPDHYARIEFTPTTPVKAELRVTNASGKLVYGAVVAEAPQNQLRAIYWKEPSSGTPPGDYDLTLKLTDIANPARTFSAVWNVTVTKAPPVGTPIDASLKSRLIGAAALQSALGYLYVVQQAPRKTTRADDLEGLRLPPGNLDGRVEGAKAAFRWRGSGYPPTVVSVQVRLVRFKTSKDAHFAVLAWSGAGSSPSSPRIGDEAAVKGVSYQGMHVTGVLWRYQKTVAEIWMNGRWAAKNPVTVEQQRRLAAPAAR